MKIASLHRRDCHRASTAERVCRFSVHRFGGESVGAEPPSPFWLWRSRALPPFHGVAPLKEREKGGRAGACSQLFLFALSQNGTIIAKFRNQKKMTVKEAVIERIKSLPENISARELHARMDFILGIQEALESSERGDRVSVRKVRKKISAWASR